MAIIPPFGSAHRERRVVKEILLVKDRIKRIYKRSRILSESKKFNAECTENAEGKRRDTILKKTERKG